MFEKAKPRLENLGIEVEHANPSRAKALIKLALQGFDKNQVLILSMPFRVLSKWLGPAFGCRHAYASNS